MIGRVAALVLLSTMSQTQLVPGQISFSVAELGANFTLRCSVSQDDLGLFYWYKMSFGYMIQTVVSGTFNKVSLHGHFDNSRFKFTKNGVQYALNIRNVSKEDEATYFCQAGTAYEMSIVNGTLLAVNDHKNQQKYAYVKQTPKTTSAELGSSATFQCSLLSKNKEDSNQCSEEHSVYWFRPGSEGLNPSVIYTHSEEEERRSCVYSFSKTIHNSSDAGTYYCAVVTCGEILFGEGTEVRTTQELWPLLITFGILLACCVVVIVILVLSRKQNPVSKHCNAEQDRSTEDQPSNVNDETGSLNYAALDFSSKRAKRWKNKEELPEGSLYAFMKD